LIVCSNALFSNTCCFTLIDACMMFLIFSISSVVK
jgi:hypothetical protein